MASETALSKQEQQTIKTIIASICEPSNSSLMESQSDNEMCDNITIEFADKPPLKTPICYSINQTEVLQNLGNYTFASQFKADDFIQKVKSLIKKPEPTNINRRPALWRE